MKIVIKVNSIVLIFYNIKGNIIYMNRGTCGYQDGRVWNVSLYSIGEIYAGVSLGVARFIFLFGGC